MEVAKHFFAWYIATIPATNNLRSLETIVILIIWCSTCPHLPVLRRADGLLPAPDLILIERAILKPGASGISSGSGYSAVSAAFIHGGHDLPEGDEGGHVLHPGGRIRLEKKASRVRKVLRSLDPAIFW